MHADAGQEFEENMENHPIQILRRYRNSMLCRGWNLEQIEMYLSSDLTVQLNHIFYCGFKVCGSIIALQGFNFGLFQLIFENKNNEERSEIRFHIYHEGKQRTFFFYIKLGQNLDTVF